MATAMTGRSARQGHAFRPPRHPLPDVYRAIFLYLEPVLTLISALLITVDPADWHISAVPTYYLPSMASILDEKAPQTPGALFTTGGGLPGSTSSAGGGGGGGAGGSTGSFKGLRYAALDENSTGLLGRGWWLANMVCGRAGTPRAAVLESPSSPSLVKRASSAAISLVIEQTRPSKWWFAPKVPAFALDPRVRMHLVHLANTYFLLGLISIFLIHAILYKSITASTKGYRSKLRRAITHSASVLRRGSGRMSHAPERSSTQAERQRTAAKLDGRAGQAYELQDPRVPRVKTDYEPVQLYDGPVIGRSTATQRRAPPPAQAVTSSSTAPSFVRNNSLKVPTARPAGPRRKRSSVPGGMDRDDSGDDRSGQSASGGSDRGGDEDASLFSYVDAPGRFAQSGRRTRGGGLAADDTSSLVSTLADEDSGEDADVIPVGAQERLLWALFLALAIADVTHIVATLWIIYQSPRTPQSSVGNSLLYNLVSNSLPGASKVASFRTRKAVKRDMISRLAKLCNVLQWNKGIAGNVLVTLGLFVARLCWFNGVAR